MVACPNCTAKFTAASDIESRWLEAHMRRVHEAARARASFRSLDTNRAA